MSRAAAAIAVLLVATACSSTAPSQSAATGVPCQRQTLPVAAAGQPPPAVLQDVAAAASEYVVGIPGAVPAVISVPSTGAPHLADGTLWVTRPGGTPEVEAIASGSCRRIATGELVDVSPDGKTLLVSKSLQAQVLVDSAGHRLAQLAQVAVVWLAGGRAAAINGTTIAVYSGPAVNTVPHAADVQVVGGLGADRLVAVKGRSTLLLSLTGQTAPLVDRLLQPAAGSPDGRYVAGLDPYADQLLLVDTATGATVTLPNPGAVVRVRWSGDSQWVAVDGRYGGSVIHVADRGAISLGSLNVLSW